MSNDSFTKDLDAYFHGPNFWQTGLYPLVKDVTFEQAQWKPAPERNSIWDIVRHINSWKWFAIEILKGNKVKSMKKLNWIRQPKTPTKKEWKDDIDKLKSLQDEFKKLSESAGDEFFNHANKFSGYTREVIYHDCYHAGQIGLLRALQGLKAIV